MIRKKRGDEVTFTYPPERKGGEKRILKGITKEIVFYPERDAPLGTDFGDYIFFAELIEFKNSEAIRLGYYRNGRWAGQTTFCIDVKDFPKFVEEMSREKWFKDLLPKAL